MATTAAEIKVLDPDPDRRLERRVPPRHRTPPPNTYSNLAATVLPRPIYSPFPLVDAPIDHVASVARPKVDDELSHFINITVAALGLLLAAPLFLLIALAVKLSSRGPVLYTQTRIGLDRRWNTATYRDERRTYDLGGRPFTMYKFRTMVSSAEKDSAEIWATPSDDRVTPVGRLLRVTRLDEMPQLLNVVLGDMNVVGPRPERPTIFAELREAIPNYRFRQRVRPGITGWAQVNQGYDTCVDDVRRKVEYDLEYLRSRSAGRDLTIMARTLPIMFSRRFGW